MSVLIYDATESKGPITLTVRVGGGSAPAVIGSCRCRDDGTGKLLEPTSKGKAVWKFLIEHSFFTVTTAIRDGDTGSKMQLIAKQGVKPSKKKLFESRQEHAEFRVASGGVSIR